ncbi:MAG: GAF domain-containing sensor histidine kinase [Steroidobacteraceae bacterium]
MPYSLQHDVDLIQQIDAVPTILEVICRTTGMGFAAVARVTEDRWVACSVRDEIQFGLRPGGELPLETTICNEIRQSGTGVVINEVAVDPIFCQHHTPTRYGFQSYISMPIRLNDGRFFGTLCAIDPRPARVNTPATIGMFKLFSDLIAFLLEAKLRADLNETRLAEEQRHAQLREQFIAVLGHDLRNPLASIGSGVSLLKRRSLDEESQAIVALMQNSVQRMSELVENVLDFAQGRLGGGLSLKRDVAPLQPVLEQVIAELRTSSLDRQIHLSVRLMQSVSCDRARIAQLLSNLVSNAITHGAKNAPVIVQAVSEDGIFTLCVENRGSPINPALIDKLFQPFFRATANPRQDGLGLGLYIANEIAHGHGGKLEVTSSDEATRFTFTMPIHVDFGPSVTVI